MSDSDNYPFWSEVTTECQFRGSPVIIIMFVLISSRSEVFYSMVDTIRHNGAMYLSRYINIAALMTCAISLFVLREIAKLMESLPLVVSTNIG